MSDLVTGEAVVLELRLAKLPSRALAFALDLLVMVLAIAVLSPLVFQVLATVDDALAAAVYLVFMVAVLVGYPVTIETLTRGRSIGKVAMGLRVVREDGGPVRFRHALTRALAGLIVDFGLLSLFTGAVALFTSLASRRGRRVGDMLAGTVVIRERAPVREQHAGPVPMPRPLAGWAAELELSGLPDQVALAARQFLRRTSSLDPQVRQSLAQNLADQVAQHVSPAPPAGTAPESYLAAVLAERRRRETNRLGTEISGTRISGTRSTGTEPAATPAPHSGPGQAPHSGPAPEPAPAPTTGRDPGGFAPPG